MKLFSVFVVSLNLVNFVISDSVIKLYDKDGKGEKQYIYICNFAQ